MTRRILNSGLGLISNVQSIPPWVILFEAAALNANMFDYQKSI
jgi:hypothetical protein